MTTQDPYRPIPEDVPQPTKWQLFLLGTRPWFRDIRAWWARNKADLYMTAMLGVYTLAFSVSVVGIAMYGAPGAPPTWLTVASTLLVSHKLITVTTKSILKTGLEEWHKDQQQ